MLGVETYRQASTEKIPPGEVTVTMLFESDEPRPGSGGTVTLWADGRQIGEGTIPRTVPVAFSSYAGMDIGRDNGLVVDLRYEDKAPYPYRHHHEGHHRHQAGDQRRRADAARARPGARGRSRGRGLSRPSAGAPGRPLDCPAATGWPIMG